MKFKFQSDDPEIHAWYESAREAIKNDILPKMESSAFVLVPIEKDGIDPYLLLQVGAAMLLDKPLIIIVMDGASVPSRVYNLADEVVHIKSILEDESKNKLAAAIKRVLTKKGLAQ